jgi:hypothetical protein
MELAELQSAIVNRLRPAARVLAGRSPRFVELVLRRLVERTPDRYPAALFADESDREEFVAAIALEGADRRFIASGTVWLVLLVQILLPALIRAFLLWWSDSPQHRDELAGLRARLAAAPSASARRFAWMQFWRPNKTDRG